MSIKTEEILNKISEMQKTTIGNGECYALASFYAFKTGGAHIGAGICDINDVVVGGNTLAASEIPYTYNWDKFGWEVLPSNTEPKRGDIISWKANSPRMMTGIFGHVSICDNLYYTKNGFYGILTWDQNYNGQKYITLQQYHKSLFNEISGIIRPPKDKEKKMDSKEIADKVWDNPLKNSWGKTYPIKAIFNAIDRHTLHTLRKLVTIEKKQDEILKKIKELTK